MRRLALAVTLFALAACADGTGPGEEQPDVFRLSKVERIDGDTPIPSYGGTLELYQRSGKWVEKLTLARDGMVLALPDSGSYTVQGSGLRYVSMVHGREHVGVREGGTIRNESGSFRIIWTRDR